MRFAAVIAFIAGCLFCPGLVLANQLHPVSGAYFTSEVDLKVAARGIPMAWERTYRSNRTVLKIEGPDSKSYDYVQPVDGPLGFGWYSPFLMQIRKNAAVVSDAAYNTDALVDADGRYIYFEKGPGGIVLPDYADGYTLTSTATDYTLTQRGGNVSTFDSTGRLQTVKDPLGRTASLSYDGDRLRSVSDTAGRTIYTLTWEGNHITKVTDLAGRSIQYGYDGAGNLATVKHDSDTIFSYSYNASHGLTANSNALSETWSVGYRFPSTQGIAVSLTQPNNGSTVQQFDPSMNNVTITDPNGVTRAQARNNDGQLTAEQTGGVKTTTITYLGGGVRAITDADGNITKETRNPWNNVIKRVDAEGGVWLFSYNGQGRPTSTADAEGVTTTIVYDASGTLPTQITRAVGTADEVATTFSYQNGDLQSTSTDGSSTTFTYNQAGLPLTVTDPEGGVTTLTYDLVGNVTSSTDANGNKSEYSYDWRGNLLTAKDGEGNVTTYAYNAAGRLQTVTDALGRVTTTATDYSGRVTAISAPAGTTSFEYDGNGNLSKVTRGDASTSYTYDSMNRITSETDPEGYRTSYGYSNGGGSCSTCSGSSANTTPTVITDPLGGTTTSILDKLGRVYQIKDPMNNLTSMQLDKVGRVITRIDANGNGTSYAYDGLGRIKSQTDAEGGVTGFTYDKKDNLLSLTDPENNTTTFEYDKAGRKTKETRPEGQSTNYTYYANGLLKTVKDAKGQLTTYSYDKAGRLVETKFADNTKYSYQYDMVGNLTNYSNLDVQATLTYDNANRKTQEAVTIGAITKTYGYSYDSRGNKASFTSPEGVTYGYSYNKNDQPTQITTPQGSIKLEYNWVRNTKKSYLNQPATEYSYNKNNWLTGISGSAYSAAYGFDKVGNITQKTNGSATNYDYDRTYQLKSATGTSLNESFVYDKVGNRKRVGASSTNWSYNKNNELLATDVASFSYDNNGNTTSKIEGGLTTSYSYNAQDRLATVLLPDGRTAAYTYDPFGRRIKKQVGAETTLYIYADEGLIGEYTQAGTTRKTYGWRPNGIWGTNPLFQTDNNNYFFYQNDHLGTPQALTDINGQLVWKADYESFGKAKVDLESRVTNNLRFPGQYYDDETGLHWNWNRYFVPSVGNYASKDPIGFGSGELNGYRYSLNNAINLTDPTGLAVGHHYVVLQLFEKIPLPPEVREFFDKATTGPIPGGHAWDKAHKEYNKEVIKMFFNFIKEKSICSKKMTKDLAKEFLQLVKNSTNPAIKDFLDAIHSKIGGVLGVAGTLIGVGEDVEMIMRANEEGRTYSQQIEHELKDKGEYIIVNGYLIKNPYYKGGMI